MLFKRLKRFRGWNLLDVLEVLEAFEGSFRSNRSFRTKKFKKQFKKFLTVFKSMSSIVLKNNIHVIFAWVKRSESFWSKSNVELEISEKEISSLKPVKVGIGHLSAQTAMLGNS